MDEQQTPIAGTPIYQESSEKNAKWLWLLIVLIIISALVFAYVRGVGPFAGLKSGEEASPSPLALFSPSPRPEATSEAALDKSEPTIRVLNGSGTAGIASAVKNLLEGKGWKVASVGNADAFDYEQTVLKFKSAFKKFEKTITADLADDYSTITSSDELEATDSADIEVIVGQK